MDYTRLSREYFSFAFPSRRAAQRRPPAFRRCGRAGLDHGASLALFPIYRKKLSTLWNYALFGPTPAPLMAGRGTTARSGVVVRMLWESAAMSAWRAKAVPIAQDERSSPGTLHGLSRFRCKSCGRTFNALTKTAMAHLHKRERWFDHARAMIEGKSLARTAELCGVHPTTAFRWRHRFLSAPWFTSPEN